MFRGLCFPLLELFCFTDYTKQILEARVDIDNFDEACILSGEYKQKNIVKSASGIMDMPAKTQSDTLRGSIRHQEPYVNETTMAAGYLTFPG